jgi:hypothetical protein
MRKEAPVLGPHHGFEGERRDIRDRRPAETPPCRIHAQLVEDLAVPVEELFLARAIVGAHRSVALHRRRIAGDVEADTGSDRDNDREGYELSAHSGLPLSRARWRAPTGNGAIIRQPGR